MASHDRGARPSCFIFFQEALTMCCHRRLGFTESQDSYRLSLFSQCASVDRKSQVFLKTSHGTASPMIIPLKRL